MTFGAVDGDVASEGRSLVGVGVSAVVAADLANSVGAVAAGGIGQGLQNPGLNLAYIEDLAAAETKPGDTAEQDRRFYQHHHDSRA
jgi:hypothetical protein